MTPTVDPYWIRNPSDRQAIAEGCSFDPDAGAFVCDFLESFCRQSKGKWAGQPITLMGWQRDFLMRLYGWRRPDGTRRFRTAYLEVAKKNGKSTLLSGLGLYHLIADGEPGPEVYICACDRSQSGIIFEEASKMVAKSPDLGSRLESIPSNQTIASPANDGKLEALSADVPSKDGKNASLVIFDELHRQPGDAMYGIMRYAGASREQPLHIDITTAGEDERGIWFERREHSDKVNAGTIVDTSHLGVVYRADPADDLDDPSTWRKANPSLGETIREDDFARELAEARRSPRKWANFLRLRLGIVINSAKRYISAYHWNLCNGLIAPEVGAVCYGGLDLATTTDLTAYVLVFPDGDGGFDVICRAWVPEESAVVRELEDNVPYRAWHELGAIEFTPGNVVDYGFIEAAIKADCDRYDVRKVFADPYNATQLCLDLQADGCPVEFLRQGYLSLSGPTKELERLILSRLLRHGGHPVLSWCASNAICEEDSSGNIKLSKRKSKERIDLLAALVNAIAAATAGGETAGSIYETQGIQTL